MLIAPFWELVEGEFVGLILVVDTGYSLAATRAREYAIR